MKIMFGQHRTYAGNEFVFRIGTPDNEWRALLGTQLCPQVHQKMPKCFTKILSTGFQVKATGYLILTHTYMFYKLHCMHMNMRTLKLQDEVWSEKVLKKLKVSRDSCSDGVFGKKHFYKLTRELRQQ